MSRRYREKARSRTAFQIATRPVMMLYLIKRWDGMKTHEFNTLRCLEKRAEEQRRLECRVYQTGEWWLFTDVYQREQARAYFS